MVKKTEVALVKGNSRYENIISSLNFIEKEILKIIKNKENILIKPNCVSESVQLASTHVDAIRAVLDFLQPYNKNITIAEGSAYKTKTAFKNFNYFSLKDKYNVNFLDLDNDKYEEIIGYDRNMEPIKFGIARTMLKADCIISLTIPKTHDSAIATFGIKNVAVGSLIKKTLFPFRIPIRLVRKIVNRLASIRNDKAKVHQGPRAINKNIFEIYKKVKPAISVIDGFEAMEGNGPIDGSPVKMKIAIAGGHALATDLVAAKLIGLEPENIGYLYYCMKYENFNFKDLKVIGNTSVKKEKRKFKMHDNIQRQIGWR